MCPGKLSSDVQTLLMTNSLKGLTVLLIICQAGPIFTIGAMNNETVFTWVLWLFHLKEC